MELKTQFWGLEGQQNCLSGKGACCRAYGLSFVDEERRELTPESSPLAIPRVAYTQPYTHTNVAAKLASLLFPFHSGGRHTGFQTLAMCL